MIFFYPKRLHVLFKEYSKLLALNPKLGATYSTLREDCFSQISLRNSIMVIHLMNKWRKEGYVRFWSLYFLRWLTIQGLFMISFYWFLRTDLIKTQPFDTMWVLHVKRQQRNSTVVKLLYIHISNTYTSSIHIFFVCGLMLEV